MIQSATVGNIFTVKTFLPNKANVSKMVVAFHQWSFMQEVSCQESLTARYLTVTALDSS